MPNYAQEGITMKDETRENLVNTNLWIRALNMVLFMFAYGLAKAIIVFVALFQFISILFTGRANAPLLSFGKNLSVFIYEVLEFQTFNTEIRPFPFSTWPDEEHGGGVWLEDGPVVDREEDRGSNESNDDLADEIDQLNNSDDAGIDSSDGDNKQ
ncbi:MAG: hypothetical protein ACI9CE_000282 [Flavobacterium sp.]|jgi:hypothetical protein